uniref:Ubiquitin-like protease family profile domain-containing protein n=1 Tax=Solanum lycopersicum TaxID=4081 RepID=A0A3Q7E9Y8_SOLLC
MDDQAEFNNPSFELLNVIYDQTEKMEQEELGDTNKPGSSNADELVVEEDFIFPKPLQIVDDNQTKINTERSIVLHTLLVVDEHTPLPISRERRPGPFNTSPYVTTFSFESGSSSRFHYVFELKHPFVAMSDVDLTTLYLHFLKWLNEGLLVRHSAKIGKEERYKKNKSRLQMWFYFGIVTVQNKNWFYRLAYKDQLLDDSHIDVILYYIRKRAKYFDSDNNEVSFITVDCHFNKLIANVWDAYYNLDSIVNKESTEESIIEYINGYRFHVAAPWHTVDNILIPVNIEQIFHWVLIVVSFNERCIHVYDSLRGGSLHNSSVSNEIKKYAQLIPMYLSKSGFYRKKSINISSYPKYKSHSEVDSFEIIHVNDITQQHEGSLDCGLYVAAYADHISKGNLVPIFDP